MPSDSSSQSHDIPLAIPEIGGNEWEYIKDCLDTGWVSSVGSYVNQFERMLADFVGAKEAIATTSGTAALHVALMVAGIQPNDEVLVSNLSFVAPANAIRYVGGWPVFMDADPDYWQMDSEKVADFLKNGCSWVNGHLTNKATGRRIAAILPVHILGNPCNMEPIMELARTFNLKVIEDASESLGATYHGKPVGNIGDIGCFSFNGNKLITSGGGGMVVTDNSEWAERARYLTTQAKDDSLEYIHSEIGYNYRLTNIQAALGVAQMERIDSFIEQKRAIATRYASAFRDQENLSIISRRSNTDPTYWLYTVLLNKKVTLEVRKKVIQRLNEMGIGARPLWHTLHNLPPYQTCQAFKIDHSISLYHRGISLPSSVGLTKNDQDHSIKVMLKLCGEIGI